jgi:hypothetical protein
MREMSGERLRTASEYVCVHACVSVRVNHFQPILPGT